MGCWALGRWGYCAVSGLGPLARGGWLRLKAEGGEAKAEEGKRSEHLARWRAVRVRARVDARWSCGGSGETSGGGSGGFRWERTSDAVAG